MKREKISVILSGGPQGPKSKDPVVGCIALRDSSTPLRSAQNDSWFLCHPERRAARPEVEGSRGWLRSLTGSDHAPRWLRMTVFILLLLCCLTLPAFAGSASLESDAQINAAGRAQVHITLSLSFDTPPGELRFPLPPGAAGVQLNGKSVAAKKGFVELPADAAGSYTFTVQYRLDNTLEGTREGLFLSLPLVSGFAHPIDSLAFSVTLPGAPEHTPIFVSAYHAEAIGQSIRWQVSGNTLSGQLTEVLKDHETLTLRLQVEPAMFPQRKVAQDGFGLWGLGMLGFGGLAILYFLLFLRPALPQKTHICNPPAGIDAGCVGAGLTNCGLDLTLLVFSWAGLGYVGIRLEGRRITLEKRMDMGNERSDFELQLFKRLFKNRESVSGLGRHYAALARKAGAQKPMEQELYTPSRGKIPVFRALALASGVLGGVCLAISTGAAAVWQVVLGILFSLLFGLMSFLIQEAGKYILLRQKLPVYFGLGSIGLWLLIGLVAGNPLLCLGMMAFQCLCGLAAAFGGKRTEGGKRSLSQILSLRRYLKTASPRELKRMLIFNPNYFYELAPYSLALGVDKTFAKRFGRAELPECSFLVTPNPPKNAKDWAALLRKTAQRMDEMQKKMRYRQIFRR